MHSETHSSTPSPSRALVLAGGGAAGNAWEIGVLAGLAGAGVPVVGTSDLIVGTSAGATAAAQLTNTESVAALYEAALVPPPAHARRGARTAGLDYLTWSQQIIDRSRDAADMRRRIGRAALHRDEAPPASDHDGAASARWRDVVAARLPGARWPEQRVVITALDARTGEPVVFDGADGVDLIDAVAASTSPLVPYRIGDGRYLDGGNRRNENADLAAGFDRVLILVPFGGRSRSPHEWGLDLATQVAELRNRGAQVLAASPDARAGDAFDSGALDPATRPRAARGGYEQGRELAPAIARLWG